MTFANMMHLKRARLLLLLLLLLVQTTSIVSRSSHAKRRERQSENDDGLRYMVGLSEPLQSTLEWDYDPDDQGQLAFRWNITLAKGQAGIFAFSNNDLETDGLDVLLFYNDQLYNVFTDEESFIDVPREGLKASSLLEDSRCLETNKKLICSIDFVRPFDTCDEQNRNYIIDRGTTHILTGFLSPSDIRNLQNRRNVRMDVEKMNLTLQRVQLLKPQVEDIRLRHCSLHFHSYLGELQRNS